MKIFKTLIAGLFLFTATGMLHLFTGSGLVHAQNRYVAPDGTNSGNCSAGSSPCATIVYALNWSEQGDVIHVQAGTYTETLFIGKNVTIRGAGAGETIIQAHAVRGFATSRVVHVGESATSARIEDVTIRHGNDPVAGSVGGGGIFVQGTLAVVNASVESNNAAGTGGGLSGETTSRITLANTAVSGNAAVAMQVGTCSNSTCATSQVVPTSMNSG
ncbi:MAG: hypothetical protein EA364_14420 [Balneolaceae bacterium]|nr:MAG: hypothetical protein EA364_14420 [Balneolaceae bacterium]